MNPRVESSERKVHSTNGPSIANSVNRIASRATHNELGEVFVTMSDNPEAQRFLRAHWAPARDLDGPSLWLELWDGGEPRRIPIPPGTSYWLYEQDRVVVLGDVTYRFL